MNGSKIHMESGSVGGFIVNLVWTSAARAEFFSAFDLEWGDTQL